MVQGLFLNDKGRSLPVSIRQSLVKIYHVLENRINDQAGASNLMDEIKQLETVTHCNLLKKGKQSIMILAIHFEGQISMVLKIYNLHFQDLIHHILSQREVENRLPEWIEYNSNQLKFHPMNTFGIGIQEREMNHYSFLFQEYCGAASLSKLINNFSTTKELLIFLVKYLGQAGFIIDVSPTNLRVEYNSEKLLIIIHYLDLILFSDSELRNLSKVITRKLLSGETVDQFEIILDPTMEFS